MASSPVAICNVALARIGQKPIMSLDDNTDIARLCKIEYDPSRKSMLREMRPAFARARFSVPELGTKPVWGYEGHGLLPPDYLLGTEVELVPPEPWAIEGNTILTDAGFPLNILYIRDEEDTTRFDSTFEDALADKIAAEVAFSITKHMGYRKEFFATARFKTELAQNVDAQQGSPEIPPANLLIDVRDGGMRIPKAVKP